MTRAIALAAALTCACATVPGRARADGPLPGYTGKGQLVVQTLLGGTELAVGGDIALEEKATLLRLDLLSLAIPGAGSIGSAALATQLFPPGGFTVVFDQRTAGYTIWSNAKRAYYTSVPAPTASAAPQPNGPAAAIGAAGSLFSTFSFARSLKNLSAFNVSISLAGRGTVNGHPATGVDYQFTRTTTSGETTDIHGRLQLADDLDDVPVQVTASGKGKSFPQSEFSLDLTTLAKANPPDSDFRVPDGYTRASDIGTVIGASLPHP